MGATANEGAGMLGESTLASGAERLLAPQLHILSTDALRELHWATLTILERTGVFVEHEGARELLRGAGARVAGERVYIPAHLVEAALRGAPSNVTLFRRTGEPIAYLGGRRVYFSSHCDLLNIIDPYTGERRPFTSHDYPLLCHVAEASRYIAVVGGPGAASDLPPQARNQANFLHTARHTSKAIFVNAHDEEDLAQVVAMAEVVAGGREALRACPFILPKAEPTAPLSHVRGAMAMLLYCARERLPVVYYSMTAAGTTAPCSDAGALVVANADVLSGLVVHQLAAPGAPFVYGQMPGIFDMAATQWPYGSPDFFLLQAAATELCQFYDLPMMGTGGCSDAKDVDVQSATELALSLLLAAQSGANLVHDVGQLDTAMTASPEQIMLADEVLGMVAHMVRGVEISPAELQLDLVDQVGPRGEFLTSEHTLHHFRRYWYPQLFERRRREVWQEAGGQSRRERLNELTRQTIEQTTVPPLPEATEAELARWEKSWR